MVLYGTIVKFHVLWYRQVLRFRKTDGALVRTAIWSLENQEKFFEKKITFKFCLSCSFSYAKIIVGLKVDFNTGSDPKYMKYFQIWPNNSWELSWIIIMVNSWELSWGFPSRSITWEPWFRVKKHKTGKHVLDREISVPDWPIGGLHTRLSLKIPILYYTDISLRVCVLSLWTWYQHIKGTKKID